MKKITILRRNTESGRKWWIKDWQDYLNHLSENNLHKPRIPFAISADSSTEHDYNIYMGDFESEIPLIFNLDQKLVEVEIIDG